MKEKTKEMADQVGAVYPTLLLGRHDGVLFTETELETFVGLIAAHKTEVAHAEAYRCGVEAGAVAEREACADIVDNADTPDCGGWNALGISRAIRARGTT